MSGHGTALASHYEVRLVCLSIFIAVLASYTALDVAGRTAATEGRARATWLSCGAMAMGIGIWAMHYVGMLAFHLPVAVMYDVPTVLLSLAAAVLASLVALAMVCRRELRALPILGASVVMGGGIATMHYVGMAAMRLPATCVYNPTIVAASIAVAVATSFAAMWIAFHLRTLTKELDVRKIGSAALMGTAICAMHYTGMAAATFYPSGGAGNVAHAVPVSFIGLLDITFATCAILGLTVVTTLLDRRFSAQALELAASEKRYRRLFERSLAGVFRTHSDGTLKDCNDAFAQLFGYPSRGEILDSENERGKKLPEAWRGLLDEVRAEGYLWNFEVALPGGVPGASWLLVNATMVVDAQERDAGVEGTVIDISAQKNAVAQLRQAKDSAEATSKAKGEFLANMSHEIRTPLNGIIGMTDLALSTTGKAEQREYLELARTSADVLLAVINDILDFSKIEAGRLELESIDVDVRELSEKLVKTMALRGHQKGLRMSCSIDPRIPAAVRTDPTRLRQILTNLIGNAVKFTERGSVELRVEAAAQDGECLHVRFCVKDTGIGIAPEKQGEIYDAFTQADASTTRKYGGTGLGLAISRRLVEMLGGKLSVESEPGRGTQFSFTVRCAAAVRAAGGSHVDAGREIREGKTSALRVLVAEDNAVNRLLAQRLLERQGHSVRCVVNGREAVEALTGGRELECDLVLMDIQMPEVDGLRATELVREWEMTTGGHIPIIALTAHAMKGDAERCLRAGMDACVTKPIDPAKLFQAIRDLGVRPLEPSGGPRDSAA